MANSLAVLASGSEEFSAPRPSIKRRRLDDGMGISAENHLPSSLESIESMALKPESNDQSFYLQSPVMSSIPFQPNGDDHRGFRRSGSAPVITDNTISPLFDSSQDQPASPHTQPSQDSEVDLATEPTLCKEQQDLVDLVIGGANVFYTGSAGCGKSTVLKTVVKKLRERNDIVNVIAPTGRAALQVGGMSTWSYMGWTPDYHKFDIKKLKRQGFRDIVKMRLKNTDVLIIDEISMVENHHLERINECMKEVRYWDDKIGGHAPDAPAFGGVQVIVTGDFCQLPPVKPFQFCMECGEEMLLTDTGTEYDCPENHGPFPEIDKWAFKSKAWEEAAFTHVHLKEIHRQKDENFIRMLQKCRLGVPFSPDETEMLMEHPCIVEKATKLLCTRKEVARINLDNFKRMKTPIHQYEALDDVECKTEKHLPLIQQGKRDEDGKLLACKDHRLEPTVALRGGMLVILQMNLDIRAGLVNGSQGVICGFESFNPAILTGAAMRKKDGIETPYAIIAGDYKDIKLKQMRKFMREQEKKAKRNGISTGLAWPRVRFHNGVQCTIYASCVVNAIGNKEPYSLLHRTQIPLVAGWAISVHKSQGMTLNRVIVDLSKAFEEGQVYVALSRATSLDGLKVAGDRSGLSVGLGGNPEVQKFLSEKFGHGALASSQLSSSQQSLVDKLDNSSIE